MFQSAYQDGECVEVFSPTGKDPAVAWKLTGKVGRLYDKGVKGFVLSVGGGATSKMQIPKTAKGTLGLRQRHLVLQVLTGTSPDKPFSIELGLTDAGGTKRRLVLSSSFRALHCTPLHAQIPLPGLERHRGSWANLSIDLVGLTAACFRADAFRALDVLAIGPTCRVRKIFTMRGALGSSEDGDGDPHAAPEGPDENRGVSLSPVEPLPLRMAFPSGVNPPPQNWVISPSTLRALMSRGMPQSPSDRTPVARSSGGGRSKPPSVAPSPRPSPLPRRRPSLPGAGLTSALQGAEGQRAALSVRGGVLGKGAPSPRRVAQASVDGESPPLTRTRQASNSSLGASAASTRPTYRVTSPLAMTPGSSSGCSAGRLARTPSSAGALEKFPSVASDEGRFGEGSVGGATAEFTDAASPANAVAAPTSAARSSTAPDESYGRLRRGLPARRRASESAASAAAAAAAASVTTSRAGADSCKIDDGCLSREGSGEAGARTGQAYRDCVHGDRSPIARPSAGDRHAVSSSKGGQEGFAPAWSFVNNENDLESSVDRMPPSATRLPEPSPLPRDGIRPPVGPTEAVVASRAENPVAARSNSYRSPATASSIDRERLRPGSGHAGTRKKDEQERQPLRSRQSRSDDIPDEIETSRGWEDNGNYDSGSIKRVSTPLRSSGAGRSQRPSPRSRESREATPVDARAGEIRDDTCDHWHAGAAVGGHSFSPAVLGRQRNNDVPKVASSANLFKSPFSNFQEQDPSRASRESGDSACQRSETSPTSARLNVLETLLDPLTAVTVVTGQDWATGNATGCGLASSGIVENRETAERDARSLVTVDTPQAKGERGTDDSGACGGDRDGDALEHLLLHNVSAAGEKASNFDRGRGSADGGTGAAFACAEPRQERTTIAAAATLLRRNRRDPNNGTYTNDVDVETRIRRQNDGSREEEESRTNMRKGSPAKSIDTAASDRDNGLEIPASPLGLVKKRVHKGRNQDGSWDCKGIESFAPACGGGVPGLLRSVSRDHLRGNEGWRNEGRRASGLPRAGLDADLPELDELKRKELALVDLEDSYHTEFGSVDLSQSPSEALAAFDGGPFSALRQAAGIRDVLSSTPPRDVHRGATGDIIGSVPSIDRDDGGGTDSVGIEHTRGEANRAGNSRDTAVFAAPGARRGVVGHNVVSPSDGGGLSRKTPGRSKAEGSDAELFFDPVLNCYYDKAADKYYGLR